MKLYPIFFSVLIASLTLIGCQESEFLESDSFPLTFSNDTVLFDTVFTSLGTTTKRFTVHNKNNAKVLIKTITLAKNSASNFSINVDGIPGTEFYNIEIDKNDSMYVFVEANIDPNRDEMVETDSIIFNTGKAFNDVKLVAFGQDVNLIAGQTIDTETWTSEKPYLIYDYVHLSEGHTLTIEAGTCIYFHYGTSMLIDGTLIAQGNVNQPITFRADRLEPFYADKSGQWGAWIEQDDGSMYLLGGLHFTKKSKNNYIDHAIIEKAIKGIQIDSIKIEQSPGLTITNTIILHMNLAGIIAQTSSIVSHNLVVNDCGMYGLALLLGGDYSFNHATIACYTPYNSRTTPAVIINNYYSYNQTIYAYNLYQCRFTNSIIHGKYGNNQSEIGIDLTDAAATNYFFDHCLLQIDHSSDTTDIQHFNRVFSASDGVGYTNIGKYDFSIDSQSVARNKGLYEFGALFPIDIQGNSRILDQHPDLGAFEQIDNEDD